MQKQEAPQKRQQNHQPTASRKPIETEFMYEGELRKLIRRK